MKKRLVLPGIFAASLEFATIASAQTPRQIIKQIDANGILRAGEVNTAQRQAVGRRSSGPGDLDPYASDKNQDGFVSRDEFVSYIAPWLLRADRNGDRALSRSELRALR